MIHARVLCCVSLLFLSSCASTTNTAPPPEQLTDLLKKNLVLLPADNFERLPPSLKESEIIFLGEVHRVKPLAHAADRLAVYLAAHKPVVYALEGCYGGHTLMEAVSLGAEKKINPNWYSEILRAFNSAQSMDRKILLTALDIEHSVYNNKPDTVRFLHDLSERSTSQAATQAIDKQVVELPAQDTYDKMARYLKDLRRLFLRHFDTFSADDRKEILFSLELLQASNRFRYLERGGTGWAWEHPHNLRYRYFIETIKRAYRKAQKRKAILLCRVGNGHISLEDKTEARYFAKDYSLTKRKIATISLVPLYSDVNEPNDTVADERDVVDSIVETLMRDSVYSYLSLSDLQKGTDNSFEWCKYYSKGRPKYDGLLFVRIEKNLD